MNKAKSGAAFEAFFVPRIRGLRESAFWILAGVSLILLLALTSYSPIDPAFSVAGGESAVSNRMGPAGAWFADVAFLLFGETAYLFPILVLVAGVFLFRQQELPEKPLAGTTPKISTALATHKATRFHRFLGHRRFNQPILHSSFFLILNS